MNNLYKKTINNVLLGLISAFIVIAFASCDSEDDGDKKKKNDFNITDCLPGQKC